MIDRKECEEVRDPFDPLQRSIGRLVRLCRIFATDHQMLAGSCVDISNVISSRFDMVTYILPSSVLEKGHP